MSFSDRPQAWCTPMGLFAVIGPSRNDQRGPFAVCLRSCSKIRFSPQKRRISRSMAGKSGTLGTGRYILMEITGRKTAEQTPRYPDDSTAHAAIMTRQRKTNGNLGRIGFVI